MWHNCRHSCLKNVEASFISISNRLSFSYRQISIENKTYSFACSDYCQGLTREIYFSFGKRPLKLKADRLHPRDHSTHRQTPWTDNDSSLLFVECCEKRTVIPFHVSGQGYKIGPVCLSVCQSVCVSVSQLYLLQTRRMIVRRTFC